MSEENGKKAPRKIPGGWLEGRLVLKLGKTYEAGERQLLLCGKGIKWDVRASLGTESGNISLFREQVRAGIQVALSGRMSAMLALIGEGLMDNSHTQRFLTLTDHMMGLLSESSVSSIAARLKAGDEVEVWRPPAYAVKKGDQMAERLAKV